MKFLLVDYRFVCVCGCGGLSSALKTDYIRLPPGTTWMSKACFEKGGDTWELVRPFKDGVIVRESDF